MHGWGVGPIIIFHYVESYRRGYVQGSVGHERVCSTFPEEVGRDLREEVVHQWSIEEWAGVHQEAVGEAAVAQVLHTCSLEAKRL